MVWTLERTDTPRESIENLLCVKQMHFHEQPIDWEYLLDNFSNDSQDLTYPSLFAERMQFLYLNGLSLCLEALAFKIWWDHIKNMIKFAEFNYYNQSGNQNIISTIQEKTLILKQNTISWRWRKQRPNLSLHCGNWGWLWMRMLTKGVMQKKVRIDPLEFWKQCLVTCWADAVIVGHVLPFLLTFADEESDSYIDADSYFDSDTYLDSDSYRITCSLSMQQKRQLSSSCGN